ncbi:ISLre2 family transposase [Proteinivorax hydrogeniformans]|uniref:ISLre2 family transposase n=1 Tax=Proteinivorax hydrogeniformans TaxID=1826727 RepID=A0AAU8HTB9_9FIRM
MEIIRVIEEKILHVTEKVLETLEGGIDYNTFTKELKKELDGLGVGIMQEVIEAMDQQIVKDKKERKDWVIERKGDYKSILTPFGEMTYKRTYFKNKETKKYSYLADENAGITAHMRIEPTLKSELLEATTKLSYEKATQELSRYNSELKLSKQTAANTVRDFKAKDYEIPCDKKEVPTLYIEADEDHLSVRSKRGAQARLIYVHEGVKEVNGRRMLINPKYFTSIDEKPEDFWFRVCDFIYSQYDVNCINDIYILGDGAKWIRSGLEYIPSSTFILDKFHLSKYIIMATAHAPNLKTKIYKNIKKLDREAVLENLKEALAKADSKPRKKRIQKTITYIKNTWDGIKASIENPEIGCSAEGHVSHVLSSRLSSRPMAWSLNGAKKMASMRAVEANKEQVKDHYLETYKQKDNKVIELTTEVRKQLKDLKTRKKIGKESFSNVPVMEYGVNLTRVALRGLNNKISI